MPTLTTGTASLSESARSLSRHSSAWNIMWASVIKDLRITRRYIPNIVGTFVELVLRVAFFLLLSSAISIHSMKGFEQITGMDLFIYFQSALLLLVFSRPTLWGPIEAVTNDLYNGTLEFLYSNPNSRYAYFVGTVISKVIVSLVGFLPLYLVLIFTSKIGLADMLFILLACFTVLISLTAMGIMIALLAILWQQVTSIVNILGLMFEMLAGAYIHISMFPTAVQYFAYLLPYTWGYDLIRYYSFGRNWTTILPVWQEWLIVVLYAVVYTLLSRFLLKKTEQRAKKTGLHLI
ncbi:MAG: ABC transporter permease [Proteobacteria bacterium]|nr:ABC transporter permease [Pseudomonadota bacterium]